MCLELGGSNGSFEGLTYQMHRALLFLSGGANRPVVKVQEGTGRMRSMFSLDRPHGRASGAVAREETWRHVWVGRLSRGTL